MGIEAFSLRMLCEAKRRGAVFSDTVTLGRQHLSVRPAELDRVRRLMGRPPLDPPARRGRGATFADDVLVDLLGIGRLVSMDCSGYEGADVTHDLNVPVPADHWQAYDAVVDGGTLEHVFNFPVAIASCMKMLKVGGRFFALTPANNHCGHGFYQFSPELFFRVFSEAQGFEVEHVLAIEHPFPGIELSARRAVFTVRNPADVGERVGLVNSRPVYLFVQAVKREHRVPFVSAHPQQSDYLTAWGAGASSTGFGTPTARTSFAWRVHRALPFALRRPLLGLFQRWRQDTFRNATHYRKWDRSGSPPVE